MIDKIRHSILTQLDCDFAPKAGLSQRGLADLSGVPVRTIQQYEQRQKSINKAQAEYLVMLAQVLCCEVGDLMEKTE